jgi:hypothetical protein
VSSRPAAVTAESAPGAAGDAAPVPTDRGDKEHTVTSEEFAGTALPGMPIAGTSGTDYEPGNCNIGPAEIARRRRAGHVGLGATVMLFAGLVAVGAPPVARFSVAVPAAVSASGYLQARLRFCAGFGSRGVFNFGPLGEVEQVSDDAARARDRARARQIGLASLAIGVLVGVAAAFVPR